VPSERAFKEGTVALPVHDVSFPLLWTATAPSTAHAFTPRRGT